MYNRTENDDCQIYNFVKSCMGDDRAENWKNLTKEEALQITEMATPEVLRAFLQPENNSRLVEKYANDFQKLELIENHKECGFDAFLYNRLLNFPKYKTTHDLLSIQSFFKEKEDIFFSLPEAVPEYGLRPLKSAKNYAAKIYNLLASENQTIFFELKSNAFGCYFYTTFLENIFFPLEKMNLIPAFVRWRNAHLIQWFIEAVKSREERAYKNFKKKQLTDELYDADRELERSFYEEYEDKIRRLFEMKNEFKVLQIQNTVDLSPGSINCLKHIILVRYQDFRSFLKPEVECSLNTENFEEELEKFKATLNKTPNHKNIVVSEAE